MVNEVYAKDSISINGTDKTEDYLKEHITDIEAEIRVVVGEEARVRVQRWYPGAFEEDHQSKNSATKRSVEQRLLSEASSHLERNQNLQMDATKGKSVEEILSIDGEKDEKNVLFLLNSSATPVAISGAAPRRRRRQKMRSSPVVGGDLFSETVMGTHPQEEEKSDNKGQNTKQPAFSLGPTTGHRAEIVVDGESYNVTISNATIKSLQTGYSGDMLDHGGVSIHGVSLNPSSETVSNQLQGYVRHTGALLVIDEEGTSGAGVQGRGPMNEYLPL